MENIPTYSVDLIKALDKSYPPRHPLITESDRDIWFNAGQRALVDNLLALIEQETDKDLPKVL